MDLDYVNKQIVCPDCGKRDLLYIDLNDIKTDPQFSTGVVIRSHLHEDHLLLLDIDGNGDVRTIQTISRLQEVAPSSGRFSFIQKLVSECDQIAIISTNTELLTELQKLIDHQTGSEPKLQVQIHPDYKYIKFKNTSILFLQHSLKHIGKPQIVIADDLEYIEPSILVDDEFEKWVSDATIITISKKTEEKIKELYPDLMVELRE